MASKQTRILLIAGGTVMKNEAAAACELYTSPLFLARREYAIASNCDWFVVSVKHGITRPNIVHRPYAMRFTDKSLLERTAWALGSLVDLLNELPDKTDLRKLLIELHVSDDLGSYLRPLIIGIGAQVAWPTASMSATRQLHWYATKAPQSQAARRA